MSCRTKPGTAAYVGFIQEIVGEEVSGSDWHQIRVMAERDGRSLSRRRISEEEALELANSLAQEVEADENAARALAEKLKGQTVTEGTASAIRYIVERGVAEVLTQAREEVKNNRNQGRRDAAERFSELLESESVFPISAYDSDHDKYGDSKRIVFDSVLETMERLAKGERVTDYEVAASLAEVGLRLPAMSRFWINLPGEESERFYKGAAEIAENLSDDAITKVAESRYKRSPEESRELMSRYGRFSPLVPNPSCDYSTDWFLREDERILEEQNRLT
jgi:hypothetical protein